MIDGQGRIIDYMRISVTDQCNLRCVYCMPEDQKIEYSIESGAPAEKEEVLTFDEILCVCRAAVELGVKKIKLTGGEPLVRKDVPRLVSMIRSVPGIEQVTLTTNGVLLADQIDDLAQAGITRINVSLDTLRPLMYEKITGRSCLGKVIEGMEKSLSYPEIPLRINCVPLGIDGQEPVEIAKYARKYPVDVRFIEMMPIGYGKNYQYFSQAQVMDLLQEKYGPLTPLEGTYGNGPCRYYEISGFAGKIGFISAMSHKFCSWCNRVRLTSEGYLKTCLQYETGCDLRQILRQGGSEIELLEAMSRAVMDKPDQHHFETDQVGNREERTMAQIGG